ncbi:MAG TPA: hypothetical protein VKU87_12560 [Thermomicrobiaceae bacterium]|nr:hypothetical protein [Thermomicrobiaceae bacterium]
MPIFNPELETLPPDELSRLQSERLTKLVAYVDQRMPFYHDAFAKAGFEPGDIRSIDDISRLPFTRKSDLRDHYPFGLLAVPRRELRRVHASSGTTGRPTVVCYTRHDLDVFSEVVARSLAAGGAEPGMMLHNAYGYGLFTGGLGLHGGAERLGLNVVPVSGGGTERQVTLIIDFKPDVIACTPSYAQTLSGVLAHHGVTPEQISLRFAILGAEPWTDTIRQDVIVG